MGERAREISERTVIPLTLVVAIMGGCFWLSSVYEESKAAHAEAAECSRDFKVIDERLSRIEGHLGIHVGP